VLVTEPSGVLQALGVRDAELPLAAVDGVGAVFAMRDPASHTREHVVFVTRPDGPPTGLYIAGRLHRRLG
jgi:hypothetical protein